MSQIVNLIAKKRNGKELTKEEIESFVEMVTSGDVQGCQIGAMLMAIYLNDLSVDETTYLTGAMMNSGDTLEWPEEWKGKMVDKHSTGGVGDKVSLILAPALAACDLKVPMISGRGLEHTGGTLDKLESIPGYKVSVTTEQMMEIIRTVGCCIVGQTKTLCPADKTLYAIRDVTATVSHIGLITGSIVSKKAAENLDALVLDVKFGNAAIMSDKNKARELAKRMVASSNSLGIKTTALLTDMNTPLGRMVGHSLEIVESIHCLQNKGPEDLISLTADLGGQVLTLVGKAADADAGNKAIRETLKDGSALAKFCAMMKCQGVSTEIADNICKPDFDILSVLPSASHTTDVICKTTGYVVELNSMTCAIIVQKLGAGRTKAGEPIDLAVGLELMVSLGDKITEGTPWVKVHHSKPIPEDILTSLKNAIIIQPEKPNITTNRVAEVI